MDISRRIGLWFGSLILSITLFSLLLPLLWNSWGGAVTFLFRVTMIFAFPVWCLCLPFVIAFKDAEKRYPWILLLGGTLIGPALLALWCLILQLRGGDPHTIWYGDPLAGPAVLPWISALIVGFLTTSIYLVSLRALHRSSTPPQD
jgi:hypothetical protein